MEFDGAVLRRVAALGQDPERLQDTDGAGTIVVRAWGGEERKQVVCGVLVCAEDGQGVGMVADLGLEARDDGGLGEGVGEVFEGDVGPEWGGGDDLLSGEVNIVPVLGRVGGARLPGQCGRGAIPRSMLHTYLHNTGCSSPSCASGHRAFFASRHARRAV